MTIKRFVSLLILFVTFLSTPSAQEVVNLNKLDITKAQQTYSAPSKNLSVTGEQLSIAGEKFKEGIGVHSRSVIKLKMNNGSRFTAKVGVNDSQINYQAKTIETIPLADGKRVFYNITNNQKQFIGIEGKDGQVDQGSVVFKLIHNGKEIYNSGIMRKGDHAKEIDLPVKRGILELVVDDAGDSESGDHAVWINPQIEYFEIAPTIAEADYVENIEQDGATKRQLEKQISQLPEMNYPLSQPGYDWLIDNSKARAGVFRANDNKDLVLSNGLVARVFRLSPNLATIDYMNQMTGESMLRAVSNEGTLTIDGKTHTIGGLSSQPEYAYTLMSWVDQLAATPNAFQVHAFEVNDLEDRMPWKRVRWAANDQMPTGKELVFTLTKNDIVVKVHFALYDGIPTISKWVEVINNGNLLVQLNQFKLEQLAMVEGESLVGIPEEWIKPNIHIETDYAFGGMQQRNSDVTTYWQPDPNYTSQANYPLQTPCLLEVKPPLGPETAVLPGESLTTFRVWETLMDTRDRERQGLFIRKMYRTISPWTTENPIFLHLTNSKEEVVKKAIDQCAEVGYEMVILSFGSGVNMEDESGKNYAYFRKLVEYANAKGIELGGYSLLSSRWISDEVDVINPKTGKRGGMIFGSSPCLSSEWGYNYFRKIKKFYENTGMSVFENDGSYPGNVCASTKHAYHNGLGDSQWKQYAQIQGLYQWMRSEGVYMNIPDFYVNAGSNKTGIGYREVNWSLPRERQLMLGRQNIYDGLWDRIPSMCWTFTPLTQYHGGGAAATIEPLKDHLDAYENQMMQNYGSGVQSCYRGPRLYDAPETKELVESVIDWYKKYRHILNSDLIHLRRPSGKDWDGFLHVNPQLKEKGLAMFFNPTNEDMVREITLPLYYTGLTKTATIRKKEGKARQYKLTREYEVKLNITIPANSYNWLVIE
ncbi:NPCBM/NEW2 domain-containing protein [Sunxiuqinia sp. sy24]|uniref:NPCBM/NEW2 domain-containing protein n=1 Tax=Sunxiuqinia sp. sy24 TaxID=3461495 RepID=UPI00404671B2